MLCHFVQKNLPTAKRVGNELALNSLQEVIEIVSGRSELKRALERAAGKTSKK